MLTIGPRVSQPSNRVSKHTPAPLAKGQSSGSPVDQVDIGSLQPKVAAEPERSNKVKWLAAAAGAVALLGAAGPAAAQMAPGMSIGMGVEMPAENLTFETPLAPGQIKYMRELGTVEPQDNARAEQVKETYNELVGKVEKSANRFNYEVERLSSLRERAEESPMGAFVDGAYVRVSRHGDEVVTSESRGGYTLSLSESPQATTIRDGKMSMTLYHQDSSFLAKAGDFVMNLEGETLTVNQSEPTFVQRLDWNNGNLLETFRGPGPYAITIYPGPSMYYRAQGENSDVDVTINVDGSTRVKQDGQVTVEPGKLD